MTDEQFSKLMDQFQKIDSRFDDLQVDVDTKFDQIRTILDTHTGLLDTDELERLALQKQVERHQAWIDTVSPKLSVLAQ